ncbi:uncharacterized protein Tco025E_01899 [Trypanosoma conorhini]|uniref:Uncharacterized protein n=1 Tax=Trypanosoma conorhini TaxID=83891 RepID=A0A3R7LJH8_9TRYP|nr:uncharacterized protein Tco025E_01899 [Trypanosoma conorhini]RNF25856.1 hypothetical protein Tco025E_01899 [Trypanosoma conorhini]
MALPGDAHSRVPHPVACQAAVGAETTPWGGARSRAEGDCSSCDTVETAPEMMSRYEHVIELLAAQALAQQDEINQLKAALSEAVSLPAEGVAEKGFGGQASTQGHPAARRECEKAAAEDNPSNILGKCNGRQHLPKHWRRRVEVHTVQLLETYMRHMDECLAQGLVERLRRVTRGHVIRSLDKEVLRVMQERQRPPQDRRVFVRKAPDQDSHEHHRLWSPSLRVEAKKGRMTANQVVPAPRAWPRGEAASHATPLVATEEAGRPGSSMNSSLGLCAVDPGNTTATEPNTSLISAESSVIGSSASYLRQLDHVLFEQLQHKVLALEQRLAAASSSAPSGNQTSLPSPLSPPSVATTLDCEGRSSRGSSSWSPTNSSSATNASDDINLLLDVFKGRQPVNAVHKLLL